MINKLPIDQSTLIANNIIRCLREREITQGPDAGVHDMLYGLFNTDLYKKSGMITTQQLLTLCISLRDVIRKKCNRRLPR